MHYILYIIFCLLYIFILYCIPKIVKKPNISIYCKDNHGTKILTILPGCNVVSLFGQYWGFECLFWVLYVKIDAENKFYDSPCKENAGRIYNSQTSKIPF